MIKLYLYNEKKSILGFVFYLFEGNQFVMDHDTYKDKVEMKRYFEASKCDIVGINMERFIAFCESNMGSKTVLIEEALSDLKKGTRWRAKNKYEYKKFLNFVLRAESKMMDLVNSQEGENLKKSYMMYKLLIDFAKEEVDDSPI